MGEILRGDELSSKLTSCSFCPFSQNLTVKTQLIGNWSLSSQHVCVVILQRSQQSYDLFNSLLLNHVDFYICLWLVLFPSLFSNILFSIWGGERATVSTKKFYLIAVWCLRPHDKHLFRSTHQGRDNCDAPKRNRPEVWYPCILWSCGVHHRNISGITEGWSTWVSPWLTTMCFQLSMLNIYHPYECHFKSRAIIQQAACLLIESRIWEIWLSPLRALVYHICACGITVCCWYSICGWT